MSKADDLLNWEIAEQQVAFLKRWVESYAMMRPLCHLKRDECRDHHMQRIVE